VAKWFESQKARLDLERNLLQDRGFLLDDAALRERERVEFCGVIHDGRNDVDIRIICEEGFPYRIPLFIAPHLPLTPESRHITFRTRMVCLRTAKPQEWSSKDHIVDLIPNAQKILKGQHTGDFGEEHVAEDQDLFPTRTSKTHVIMPKDLLTPPDATVFNIHVSKRFNGRVMFAFRAGSKLTSSQFSYDIGQEEFSIFQLKEMPLETIAECDHLLSPPHPDYRQMLQKYAINPGVAVNRLDNFGRSRRGGFFGVVFPYKGGWFWQFFRVDSVTKKQISITPIGTSALDALLARLTGVLDVNRLAHATVLVAGCGGIGSTVALELACAGVGTLFLNDPDSISVANVIRHECSLSTLGDQKSAALKVKISTKNPLTQVTSDGDIFLDSNFEQKVIKSDLIICTIGDYNVEDYVNRICVKHKKPVVFAYVGIYGAMGHVVRLSAKNAETGCFACFQRQLKSGVIPNLPDILDVNTLSVELGCNNPSLPAASFDQKTIALIAVRKAIQCLDPWSYVDDVADAIVFYARHLDGVVKEQSLKTKKFSVPALEDCPVCGGGARQ
jgi:molybdopterin/thiamine biosynthesis adenylyltransferase